LLIWLPNNIFVSLNLISSNYAPHTVELSTSIIKPIGLNLKVILFAIKFFTIFKMLVTLYSKVIYQLFRD